MDVMTGLLCQTARRDLPWPLVIGIFVTTIGLMILTRRRARRGSTSPRSQRGGSSGTRDARQHLEQDLRAVMLELERLARDVTAQIDTRYRKLEAVIRDADERIATLRALEDGPGAASHAPPRLDVTVGDSGVGEPVKRTRLDRTAVIAQADAGCSPTDIARQMGCSISEVELILALRRDRIERLA